jgi:hypothetical protein
MGSVAWFPFPHLKLVFQEVLSERRLPDAVFFIAPGDVEHNWVNVLKCKVRSEGCLR